MPYPDGMSSSDMDHVEGVGMGDLECLREGQGPCRGEVVERPSFAGTGTMIPECERHQRISEEREAKTREDYPDSPNPPSWFDPENAGERWDDDY